MPKIIKFRDKKGNDIFVSSLLKRVRYCNIGSGETLTDSVIKKANQVVVYYSIHNEQYKKSMTITRDDDTWFWDYGVADGHLIFFRINWQEGTISVSPASSNDSVTKVLGYDLMY